MANHPPVAVVTGATRGAGQGIATALGSHGCTVYVTGRSQHAGDAARAGTIGETAEAVTAAGGRGVPVRVDHRDDQQVQQLFERVAADEGRLDILVNNAAALHPQNNARVSFWEKPLEVVDLLDVGLRSGYVATYHAARLLSQANGGLVVFTSGSGAAHYVFNPAYGAQKAGVDKLAADMAVDFRDVGVAAVSIWMGTLMTDRLRMLIDTEPDRYGDLVDTAETTEFTGHVVWEMYSDPKLMERSGQTLIGADVAAEYGLTDVDGRRPPSYRQTLNVEPTQQFPVIIR